MNGPEQGKGLYPEDAAPTMLWIPYPNFRASARVLSAAMLGKQLYNCPDILMTHHLMEARGGLRSDFIVMRMWRDWPGAVVRMMWCCYREILLRGYRMDLPDPLSAAGRKLFLVSDEIMDRLDEVPPWLGGESLHSSHRARLLREDPEWYYQHGWTEIPSYIIEWPALLPRAGDLMVSMSEEVRRVYCVEGSRYILMGEEPLFLTIGVEDIVERRWMRAVEM